MTRRVLVVDDEQDIREIVSMSLETWRGWEVTCVASGAEAVERVRAMRPDVVLLDVMMPGQDGPDTLAALRADPETRDVPVVFLTAKMADRSRFVAMGAAGVLPKPFDPMRLGDQLAEILGWSS